MGACPQLSLRSPGPPGREVPAKGGTGHGSDRDPPPVSQMGGGHPVCAWGSGPGLGGCRPHPCACAQAPGIGTGLGSPGRPLPLRSPPHPSGHPLSSLIATGPSHGCVRRFVGVNTPPPLSLPLSRQHLFPEGGALSAGAGGEGQGGARPCPLPGFGRGRRTLPRGVAPTLVATRLVRDSLTEGHEQGSWDPPQGSDGGICSHRVHMRGWALARPTVCHRDLLCVTVTALEPAEDLGEFI